MLKEALKYLQELTIKPDERVVDVYDTENKVNRILTFDSEGNATEIKPVVYRAKAPLIINTLNGFCHYIESQLERSEEPLFIQVQDEKTVRLLGTLASDGGREELVIAQALTPQINYSRFEPSEELVIGLQSKFVPTEDSTLLLKVLGNIKEENVRTTGDDGVSQAIKVKQGLTTIADVKVPNPVELAPYRTFLEVEQPASDFIFRMKDGPQGAIFEADGGAWRNEAIQNIATYLNERLLSKDLEATYNVTIIS